MRTLVEDVYSIKPKQITEAIPRSNENDCVELNIEGLGSQRIEITSTPSNLQGYIRWFVCPACERRSGKLYLPYGELVFLCRYCYKLGYRQQFIRAFRG